MTKGTTLQMHHISYDPEWEVEVTWMQHKVITSLQITRGSPEQYARWINFLHAITEEINRLRKEMDTGEDLRIVKRGMKRGKTIAGG